MEKVAKPPQITSVFQPYYIEYSILLLWLSSLIELSDHFYTATRHPRSPHLSLSVEACLMSNYPFYFELEALTIWDRHLAHYEWFRMKESYWSATSILSVSFSHTGGTVFRSAQNTASENRTRIYALKARHPCPIRRWRQIMGIPTHCDEGLLPPHSRVPVSRTV